jgi:hypothetical protein
VEVRASEPGDPVLVRTRVKVAESERTDLVLRLPHD